MSFLFENYNFTTSSIPVFITAFLMLFLGIYILSRSRRVENVSFFLIAISIVIWLISSSLSFVAVDESISYFLLSKIGFLSISILIASFYLFTVAILGEIEKKKHFVLVFYEINLFFYVCTYLPDVYKFIEIGSRMINIILVLSMSFGVFIAFLIIIKLVRGLKINVGIKNKRIKVVILGNLIGYLGLIDFLPEIGVNSFKIQISYVFLSLFLTIISYAIIKYKILKITPELASKHMIKTLSDYLIVVDKEYKISFVSDSVIRNLNYKKNDLINKKIDEFFCFNQLLEGQKDIKQVECNIVDKNKKERQVTINASVIKDDEGDLIGYLFIMRDITEIKKLFKELESYTLRLEKSKKELEVKNEDLERVNKLMMGREVKMKELKKENKELRNKT